MIAAKHRVQRHVAQHVVHPAHVPLEAESQPSQVRRPRHLRPRRGLFRDHHYVGKGFVDLLVERLQKLDRFQIFLSAKTVRHPSTFRPAVIEIQHGGHRVRAKAIHVVLVQPEQSVADQKILDFFPSVVEDECVPVRLFPLLGIGVLVEVRAVEIAESRLILRKMRGHPIENYADARAGADNRRDT